MPLKEKTSNRLNELINICEIPQWKYRGDSIDKYFNKVISQVE